MTREILGLIAVLFALVNTILYIHSVFRGRTRPHAFTWGIWALISAVVYFAQASEGGGPGAWLQAYNIFSCSVIMALGFWKGDRGYTRSDWIALVFSLASVPLWLATGTPLWSVVLLCVIDVAGFYPTIRKSWLKPREEPLLPYTLWGVGAMISVASLEALSLTTVLYPAFIAALNFLFAGMLTLRRK